MKGGLIRGFVLCISVCLIATGGTVSRGGELVGRWEELPLPQRKHARIKSPGVEPGGALWILFNNSVYYWDGGKFREPADDKLTSGYHWSALVGGRDRPLYGTQRGKEGHKGKLYELTDGQAIYKADFYYDSPYEPACTYVSKSGRLFNWGKRFLAVYVEGKWERIEGPLSIRGTLIFDVQETVYFYFGGRLYWFDEGSGFESREVGFGGERRPPYMRGVLWGSSTILFYQHRGKKVYAYCLDTHEAVGVEQINARITGRTIQGVHRMGDGSVCLQAHSSRLGKSDFLVIAPDGTISKLSEEVSEYWAFAKRTLNGSDGSVWLGSPENVVRYKDGGLDVFGWRQGVKLGDIRHLVEGGQGEIYAAAYSRIYVFRRGVSEPIPSWVNRWVQYRVADAMGLIRDFEGNIWTCLEAYPGKMSRWDGNGWFHVEVPFDTSQTYRAIADDQGHILVGMLDYPSGCYDVGPDGTERYEDYRSMVVAAVRRGAKRFWTGRMFGGCFTSGGDRIWLVNDGAGVNYFDGDRWDVFRIRDDALYIFESAEYDAVVRARHRKYYGYDRGQFIEIKAASGGATRWLLGGEVLQPYEQKLLRSRPGEYIPIELSEKGMMYLLCPCEADGEADGWTSYCRGEEIGEKPVRFAKGFYGGYWGYNRKDPILRVFGEKAMHFGYCCTPFNSWVHPAQPALDDRGHNLWFETNHCASAHEPREGSRRHVRYVFMKRMTDFELKVSELPSQAKRSVTVKAEALCAGEPETGSRLFWRLGGGRWRGGAESGSVKIDFPDAGRYIVELVGMGPLGGTTTGTVRFVVDASVPLPDTMLTREGPYLSKDILWEIPAEAAPSEPGQTASLAYRIDGGKYRDAYKGRMVCLAGLEPGNDWVVESRLGAILGDDVDAAQAALYEIKMAGDDVVAVLRGKLAEYRRGVRLVPILEALLRELEEEGAEGRTDSVDRFGEGMGR
jgi:hypothetical protein